MCFGIYVVLGYYLCFVCCATCLEFGLAFLSCKVSPATCIALMFLQDLMMVLLYSTYQGSIVTWTRFRLGCIHKTILTSLYCSTASIKGYPRAILEEAVTSNQIPAFFKQLRGQLAREES